ncbi:hypothetical protein J2X65_005423 [Ancylobacter sp. 3268]|nr:hypothetical protein [Ancylobacter sp. 3268]MDR6956029.1 hypothetical protein [Ancylobacter sp. 3268]
MIRLGLSNAATIEDPARIARRRMPAIECGYLKSGTGAELARAQPRGARRDHARIALHAQCQRPLDRRRTVRSRL